MSSNYNGSPHRLSNVQRKLHQNGLTETYTEVIEKQKAEGIVEVADLESDGVKFYIPHRPVVKDNAETTKVKIVCDASPKPIAKLQA